MKTTPHNGNVVLLDVGGTFIKCRDGRSVPVDSATGTREAVAASLRSAVGAEPPTALAAAVPGPFDYARGIFLMRHKFASVYGLSFRDLAGIEPSVPCVFLHDVVAALEGELVRLGRAGRTALVTLGTGLGFSHAVDGVAQKNEMGSPLRSLYNLPFRGGVLEDYVSARGILRAWSQISGRSTDGLSVKDLAQLAYAGDTAALRAFEATGEAFAQGAAPLLEELGIDKLVFSGQISRSFSLLEGPVVRGLGKEISITVSPDIRQSVFAGLSAAIKDIINT